MQQLKKLLKNRQQGLIHLISSIFGLVIMLKVILEEKKQKYGF